MSDNKGIDIDGVGKYIANPNGDKTLSELKDEVAAGLKSMINKSDSSISQRRTYGSGATVRTSLFENTSAKNRKDALAVLHGVERLRKGFAAILKKADKQEAEVEAATKEAPTLN